MLKIPVIEVILRLIPEALLLMFAAHVFTKTVVNKNKYLLSCILFGIGNYLIRLLPIDYGIHSVLGFILFVALITNINKINIIKSIQVVFICTIVMFLLEGINVAFIQFVLKKDMNVIFANSILKTLYGVPSLLVFALVVAIFYIRTLKRKKLNYV